MDRNYTIKCARTNLPNGTAESQKLKDMDEHNPDGKWSREKDSKSLSEGHRTRERREKATQIQRNL